MALPRTVRQVKREAETPLIPVAVSPVINPDAEINFLRWLIAAAREDRERARKTDEAA